MTELVTAVLNNTDVTTPTRKDHSFPAAYALAHQATGQIYVGSTHDLYTRVNQHKTRLAAGTHRNRNLQAAYDQDTRFDLSFVRTESKEAALEIEQQLLDNLAPSGRLLNIATDARRAGLGLTISEEQKQKLREANAKQFTEEARARHSEITKAKWQDPVYREKQLGREASEESRVKSSKSVKSLWEDPEYRAKQLATRSTPESLAKSALKHVTPITLNGKDYPSVSAAARELGIQPGTLHMRLRRERLKSNQE